MQKVIATIIEFVLLRSKIGLGLERRRGIKIRPAQPEWPRRNRKILRRCMHRSTYRPQAPSGDRVAVLWKVPTAHEPRSLKGSVSSR